MTVLKKMNVAVKFTLIASIAIYQFFFCTSAQGRQKTYTFSGGPKSGIFQPFAEGISTLAKKNGINIKPISSGGAFDNVVLVGSGKRDFSIAFSSHVFMARNGLLRNNTTKYKKLMTLGYLYGTSAQLVVRADSDINSAYQLAGKKVGIGNKGSGSAIQCEIFFRSIGMWDKIYKHYLGYNDSAKAFNNKKLDAFWLFTTFPTRAVILASFKSDIKLINLYSDGEKAKTFKRYPYFVKNIIPGGTYRGVNEDTITFQNQALWIANKNVPKDVIKKMLNLVYSKEGIEHLVSINRTAQLIASNNGTYGIITDLHPGALQYYADMGLNVGVTREISYNRKDYQSSRSGNKSSGSLLDGIADFISEHPVAAVVGLAVAAHLFSGNNNSSYSSSSSGNSNNSSSSSVGCSVKSITKESMPLNFPEIHDAIWKVKCSNNKWFYVKRLKSTGKYNGWPSLEKAALRGCGCW